MNTNVMTTLGVIGHFASVYIDAAAKAERLPMTQYRRALTHLSVILDIAEDTEGMPADVDIMDAARRFGRLAINRAA